MASDSEIDDQNEVVYLETTATNNLFSAIVTLTSPPLHTLPIDVIIEILCRLPVKLLLQLRCVCKSWNSLISDSKFINKHLHMSTTHHLHLIRYRGYPQNKYILTSYRLNSVYTDLNTDFTRCEYSPNDYNGGYPMCSVQYFIGSCNGILCFADDNKGLVILWNPSIRKFKELPLFTKPNVNTYYIHKTFGFGYDSSADKYKVVVIFDYDSTTSQIDGVRNIEVKVHTLGTNTWRSIQGYPFDGVPVPSARSGKFVSGTINWLVSKENDGSCPRFIVSFDLRNESFKMILPRIGGVDMYDLCSLSVLRDCLCVTFGNDVWIMKEYGNKESWTKLFTVSYMREPDKSHVAIIPIYIFEDNHVIVWIIGDIHLNSAVYDYESGILKPTIFESFPEVSIESLISPYSLC